MPFINRILIANRGEIAVRIIRTCKDKGIKSVAIYPHFETQKHYTLIADKAVLLIGDSIQDTYLNIEQIIDICIKEDCDAIHPGYGFLSENNQFAKSVIESGIIWLGSENKSMLLLGDKISSKKHAIQHNVPVLKSVYFDSNITESQIKKECNNIGYPLIVKSSAGGGGRGTKIIDNVDRAYELCNTAIRESEKYFNDKLIFIEQYLPYAKHIEVQSMVDNYNNVSFLSTRDCSMQRRYQKLIEEAPGVSITDNQRNLLYKYCQQMLENTNYTGLITTEFLFDNKENFYFIENNTRIQVEHTITEQISDCDLVSSAIDIASGYEYKSFWLNNVNKYSIEYRILAEDVYNSFIPSIGTITDIVLPLGPGIRIDSGIKVGDKISTLFDSLLLKLIVTGKDRKDALHISRRAFDEFEISGVDTNINFYKYILTHDDFINGNIHTKWIDDVFSNEIDQFIQKYPKPIIKDKDKDNKLIFNIEVNNKNYNIKFDKEQFLKQNINIESNNNIISLRTLQNKQNVYNNTSKEIRSPIQGTVIKVFYNNGDQVKLNDKIVIVESMKMELPINITSNGIVKKLSVKVGDTLHKDDTICIIE